MTAQAGTGRTNQKQRTRTAIVVAARELIGTGARNRERRPVPLRIRLIGSSVPSSYATTGGESPSGDHRNAQATSVRPPPPRTRAPAMGGPPPSSVAHRSVGLKPRRRRLLPTTNTEENAIAAPAIIGLRSPEAARGRAATL
ncbi:hypothetical protein SALBM311S_06998 [Streptomyces alboniger]